MRKDLYILKSSDDCWRCADQFNSISDTLPLRYKHGYNRDRAMLERYPRSVAVLHRVEKSHVSFDRCNAISNRSKQDWSDPKSCSSIFIYVRIIFAQIETFHYTPTWLCVRLCSSIVKFVTIYKRNGLVWSHLHTFGESRMGHPATCNVQSRSMVTQPIR